MTMGCSRGLMSLISVISSEAQKGNEVWSVFWFGLKVRSSKLAVILLAVRITCWRACQILRTGKITASHVQHFHHVADNIYERLKSLKQKLPSRCINGDPILRIAEVKRLAAMLFLKERMGDYLSGAEHQQELIDSPPDAPRRKSTSSSSSTDTATLSLGSGKATRSTLSNSINASYSKQRLIAAIIKLVGSFKTPLATFLWPLYVVGHAGLDDEEQRRFVLEQLRAIQKTRNLGSVRLARITVERAFRTKDLELPFGRAWTESAEEGPRVISLAWFFEFPIPHSLFPSLIECGISMMTFPTIRIFLNF